MPLRFPPDFLWGMGTAAHQAEGQNFNNDWWAWEQTPGHIKNGDTSRIATDWWNGRYEEDFDRAAGLGLKSVRFSLEWSRLEPKAGGYSSEAVARYRGMLSALYDRGLVPLITLHHFSNPIWLVADGGWASNSTSQRFARFARFAAQEFGDLCDFWVTVNEPNVYAYLGFVEGSWPPGMQDIPAYVRVMLNMLRAHAGAYHAIKDVQPHSRVGVAHHFRPFVAFDPNSPLDRAVAALRDSTFNRPFMDAIEEGRFGLGPLSLHLPDLRGTQDYIGVNYYYLDRVRFSPNRPGDLFAESLLDDYEAELQSIFSTVGNIEPTAFENILARLASYGKPIYVTENGVFDDGRSLQSNYLASHLSALRRAIEGGADVRGYYWWTLVDNFEWSEGYTAQFGLYRLNLETQERTIREAGKLYSRIVKENGLADDLLETNGREN